MSKASVYEAKTESFIQPILDSMNFELVDVEYVKEGGMNLSVKSLIFCSYFL